MPTFKKYQSDAGYYILARLSNLGNVTYQITPSATSFLRNLNYEHEDELPWALVTPLREAGHVYTKGQGLSNELNEPNLDENILPELSDEEVGQLLSYLEGQDETPSDVLSSLRGHVKRRTPSTDGTDSSSSVGFENLKSTMQEEMDNIDKQSSGLEKYLAGKADSQETFTERISKGETTRNCIVFEMNIRCAMNGAERDLDSVGNRSYWARLHAIARERKHEALNQWNSENETGISEYWDRFPLPPDGTEMIATERGVRLNEDNAPSIWDGSDFEEVAGEDDLYITVDMFSALPSFSPGSIEDGELVTNVGNTTFPATLEEAIRRAGKKDEISESMARKVLTNFY